jgi:hypothetical protein
VDPCLSLRDYLDVPTEIDHQLVAGARQVRSRQSDAIMLLKDGKLGRLEELWRFDLEASPALCKAFDVALRKQAIDDDLNWTVAERLEEQLPNAKRLVAEHCDLDDGITAAETRMRRIIAVSQKADLPGQHPRHACRASPEAVRLPGPVAVWRLPELCVLLQEFATSNATGDLPDNLQPLGQFV